MALCSVPKCFNIKKNCSKLFFRLPKEENLKKDYDKIRKINVDKKLICS